MKKLLKKHFGYDEFRPLQADIIKNVLAGKDSFVLMPTGGGKSLCYQLPALKLDGMTIVISPLIALMKDQVDALKANGIPAEFINSSLISEQVAKIYTDIKREKIKLLYLAPERLAVGDFKDFLQNLRISLIAFYEAHCISEWGHDFRPEYRNLHQLKKLFPRVPVIALTATATDKVREDIVRQLGLQKAPIYMSSFNRENLRISVIEKKKAFPKLVELLSKYKGQSVIIYCFSRKETEEVTANLKLNGFKAIAYHAGIEANDRRRAQEGFVNDKVDIIVATIAFGMGIDKPDVRLVVHYTFPKTLEGYYQEIGRAGRDGLQSECVLFYTYADNRKHEFFINQINDDRLRARAQEKLGEVLNYCTLTTCRKKYLLNYFSEKLEGDNCSSCDLCLNEKVLFDATIITQKILSAVIRLENRYGKNYVVDVLLGKNNQKVLMNNHNELSVFGIVTEFSEDSLGQLVNQITDRGYLLKSEGKYPVLSITKQGNAFLHNREKLELQQPVVEVVTKKPGKPGEIDYDAELFELLRLLRKELAVEENVPPFAIFGDVSLRQMAHFFPQTNEDFARINGVGAIKLAKFGEIFLETIKGYTEEKDIKPVVMDKPIEVVEVKMASSRPVYYIKTKELLLKKIPIDRIAKNQKISVTTAINHIEKLIDAGERIDLEYLKLPRDKYIAISRAISDCGEEKLKPIFEHLRAEYTYDDIRLVRILLRA